MQFRRKGNKIKTFELKKKQAEKQRILFAQLDIKQTQTAINNWFFKNTYRPFVCLPLVKVLFIRTRGTALPSGGSRGMEVKNSK